MARQTRPSRQLASTRWAAPHHNPPALTGRYWGKISKEQRAGEFDVWQTSLHNPDFAAYAELCGAHGVRVTRLDQLHDAIEAALAQEGPSVVEVVTDALLV